MAENGDLERQSADWVGVWKAKKVKRQSVENGDLERQTWSLRVFLENMEMYGGDER